MTAATGLAMAMRLQLARLAARHGVAPATPVLVPSTAPTDHPVVVEGLAATSDVDREVSAVVLPAAVDAQATAAAVCGSTPGRSVVCRAPSWHDRFRTTSKNILTRPGIPGLERKSGYQITRVRISYR